MLKKLLFSFVLFFVLGIIAYNLYFSFTQETQELNEETRKEIGGTFIKLSKGYTYYQLQGPDTGKTVILIHGAGSGSYAWDHNFNYLVNQGFRVLKFDLYGRGFSDRVDAIYDTTLFYEQILELLDTFQLKAPYNVAAVSMGSSIALHFTKNNLDKVNSLVLTDPASLSDGSMPWYLKKPFISQVLMTAYWYPRAVEKQMREYHNPNNVPEYREKSWEQLKYKGLKKAMLSTWQNMLTLNMTKEMEQIGKSEVKVLLIWGKSDPLISPAMSEHYIKAMPQASLTVIDSAGHLSNYEKPTIFNTVVTKFIRNEE